MTAAAERFRVLSATFTDRVRGVTDWDAPAPCEGWVARDVVQHLLSWVPGMFGGTIAVPEPTGDLVADWDALRDALQAALDDPEVCARELTSQAGTHPVEQAIAMFVTGDVLVHTWDLARATGQDEALDPDAVHDMLLGMLPMDEVLRSSGQFGPRVAVAPDASEQDQLIAFTGRTP